MACTWRVCGRAAASSTLSDVCSFLELVVTAVMCLVYLVMVVVVSSVCVLLDYTHGRCVSIGMRIAFAYFSVCVCMLSLELLAGGIPAWSAFRRGLVEGTRSVRSAFDGMRIEKRRGNEGMRGEFCS